MLDAFPSSDVEEPLGDRLELLFEQLSAAGLKIGPRERINAAILLAELTATGQVAKFCDLGTWLAPLLTRSPADRERFFLVFDRFSPQTLPQDDGARSKHSPDRPRVSRLRIVTAIAATLFVAVGAAIWWYRSAPPAPPKPQPVSETSAAKTAVRSDTREFGELPTSEALKRVAEAGERFEGAPTLEELGRELARNSPIGWPAASYAIRLNELSGLPKTWPLSLYGSNARDGRIWAMVALALDRIERPGRETPFSELLTTANEALKKQSNSPPQIYDVAARLGGWLEDPIPNDKAKLIAAIRKRYSAAGHPNEALDEFTIQRALAIADDPRVRRAFPDAPWIPRHPSNNAPWWAAWLAILVPLAFAVLWFANSLALRKAYLRRRPPELPPLHLDIVSEATTRVRCAASAFQRIAQKLRLRTSLPTNRIDIEASIAATIAGGGELLSPVYEVMRQTPEYLVLIERRSAGDQDALRLRDLVGRLEAQIPLTVYFYRTDPSRLEPERGGRSLSIEELQARYSDNRLLILGSGAEFLDPVSLKPYAAAEKLKHWPQRALLTPLPLAEWGQEEFALSNELQMPIGRATSEGLLTLAELLGLEGAEAENLIDPRGDGLARPLPEILRVRPERFIYNAPPSATPIPQILRQLRNFLDGPGFEWLCALAVYPTVQWDLTLYLGVSLPNCQGGDALAAPLYREDRIAALTQLPWLREGQMPNWLRTALIKELEPTRKGEIRDILRGLIDDAQLSGFTRRDDAVKLRISREPARDRTPPEELFDDEVLLDFLARGRIEDFALPRAHWMERILPRGLLDRIGIPELTAALVAFVYAGAAFTLSPKPTDGAQLVGAWLPLCGLLIGASMALVAAFPTAAYTGFRHVVSRSKMSLLLFSVLLTAVGFWNGSGLNFAFGEPIAPSETLTQVGSRVLSVALWALGLIYCAALFIPKWERLRIIFAFFSTIESQRDRFHQQRIFSPRLQISFLSALKVVMLALTAIVISNLVDELWPATKFAWAGVSGAGFAFFLAAVVFLRLTPARLSPRKRPRRQGVNWGAGAARVTVAFLPVLPATWLSVYVANSSVRLPADIPGGATAVAELSSRSLVAIGDADGTVRVIEIGGSTPRLLATIGTGNAAVSELALWASGDHTPAILAVATSDGRVQLFDAHTGSPTSPPEALVNVGGGGSKIHVAFGPGAEPVVAYETATGDVRLATGKGALTVADSGPVTALAVDGERIAFATLDGRIRLALARDGGVPVLKRVQREEVKPSGHTRSLRFEGSGQMLVALGDDGVVRKLPIVSDHLNAAAASVKDEQFALGTLVEWRREGKVRVMVRTANSRDEEQWFKPGEGKTESFRDCIDSACTNSPEMVVVPAGSFMMGSPESEPERNGDEGPQHEVTIKQPFAVGRYPVTFSEWDACVADGGCGGYKPEDQSWGRGDRPVINVSWDDAKAYAAWLSKRSGKTYRLLSEAEREYVTRAGTTTPFWWGSSTTPDQANYYGTYVYAGGGEKGEYRAKTVPVRSFRPNAWGLYQVHGNVWDWVEDCYHGSYDDAPTDGSSRTTGDCRLRVLRGGSWDIVPRYLRSANRDGDTTDLRSNYVGFRLARTLPH